MRGPFAVHFTGKLAVAVVFISMQGIPVRVFHQNQATAGIIGVAVARAIVGSGVIGFGLYLFCKVSVRVIKTPFHAAVRITDADAVPVRVILIAGSFAFVSFFGIADRVDSVCDVPVKVAEYPLMLLQGGYDIHHPLQEITAGLIPALILLPLQRRRYSTKPPQKPPPGSAP